MDLIHATSNTPAWDFFVGSHWSVITVEVNSEYYWLFTVSCYLVPTHCLRSFDEDICSSWRVLGQREPNDAIHSRGNEFQSPLLVSKLGCPLDANYNSDSTRRVGRQLDWSISNINTTEQSTSAILACSAYPIHTGNPATKLSYSDWAKRSEKLKYSASEGKSATVVLNIIMSTSSFSCCLVDIIGQWIINYAKLTKRELYNFNSEAFSYRTPKFISFTYTDVSDTCIELQDH